MRFLARDTISGEAFKTNLSWAAERDKINSLRMTGATKSRIFGRPHPLSCYHEKVILLLFSNLIFLVSIAQWTTGAVGANYLYCTKFVSPSTVFVGGSAGLYKSTDAGATFSAVASPTLVGVKGLWFSSATNAISVGSIFGNTEVVIRSVDGGNSWSIVNMNNNGDWPRELLAVHFPTSLIGYAVGTNGRIVKTTDGGSSWSSQFTSTANKLNAVYFTSATTGYIAGDHALLTTTNGGASWTVNTRNKRIERITIDILAKVGVNELPIPISEIAEARGLELRPYDLGENVSGVLLVENGKGTIGYNPHESKVRQRFTIAHELGHYELHNGSNESGLFVDKQFKVEFRNEKSSTGEIKKEQEANAFAASILMPAAMVMEQIRNHHMDLGDEDSLKELAKIFYVSVTAMTFRINNLNIFLL